VDGCFLDSQSDNKESKRPEDQTTEEWYRDYDEARLNNEQPINKRAESRRSIDNMKAPKSGGGGDFEKHPEGQFAVRCAQIIDLGTHFNPDKKVDQRKVRIMFISSQNITTGELAGKPFALFNNFNFSMYQNSHLCKFIEQWRGKNFASQDEADEFDIEKVLNQPAYVNVVHNGKYVNIQSVMPLPEGLAAPAIPETTTAYCFSCDKPDKAILETMTDKTRDMIMASKEWIGAFEPEKQESENPAPASAPPQAAPQAAAATNDFEDDEIPF
jgi:hypothetical protein